MCFIGSLLTTHQIYLSMNFVRLTTFLCRTVLGIQWICPYLWKVINPWKYSIWLFLSGTACYSSLGHFIVWKGKFLFHSKCIPLSFVSGDSEWHVEYLQFSCWHILYFSPFFYSSVWTSEIILFEYYQCSLAVFSSWCGNCYECYIQSLSLLCMGSVLPLSLHRTWSGSMCNIDAALQKLQVVALMLYRMIFMF